MNTLKNIESINLINENIEELESVGNLNKKHYKKEGLKLLLIGLACIIGGAIGFFLILKHRSSLIDQGFEALILPLGVLALLFLGLVNLFKGIKRRVLPPPKAPKNIDGLVNCFYETFLDEIRSNLGGLGISISWLKSYVCLLKKDRDKIGTYKDFVTFETDLAKKISDELRSLIKTKHSKFSEIRYPIPNYEIELIDKNDNQETYKITFHIKIYKGQGEKMTHIGNMLITETTIACILNNRYYIGNYEWTGTPSLID